MRVASLWRYPVKSLRGLAVNQLRLDKRGAADDRRWMVVGERGNFLTQRQLPAMSRIAVELDEASLLLRHLDRPGAEIRLNRQPANAPAINVRIWRDHCEAVDMGEAAARWLSAQLQRKLRLCFMPESSRRQVDLDYARAGDLVNFADGFPLLVCNAASVAALSQRLGRPLEEQRFRPNIVVEGAPAFAEDRWRKLRIADIDLDLVKPCARCPIPSIDPGSGQRQRDVAELLNSMCRRDGAVYFGQNAIHRSWGTLRVGDAVTVLE